ncbi:MAG: pyrroline-5-carboxylate reductase [Clostridia bacterium]|nr:pyrroline-5-carboxylate reductase [Clostridia bacterium]
MKKIGFIGMGNMARAIVNGFIAGGAASPADIYAYAPNQPTLKAFADETGINACSNVHEVVAAADTVVMAVKPYVVESVLDEVKDELAGKALLSVALGWDYAKYRPLLHPDTRVQFIMPNTPCMSGEGMMLFEEATDLTAEEKAAAVAMFETMGEVEILPTRLMGVGGAVSGCGPAFIAMVIEAMADAGVKYGLPRATAYKLASQTVLGTGKMQIRSGMHPAVIKDGVCSPGGATIRGCEALEQKNLRAAFYDAIKACVER